MISQNNRAASISPPDEEADAMGAIISTLAQGYDLALAGRLHFTAHLVAIAIASLGEPQTGLPQPERPLVR